METMLQKKKLLHIGKYLLQYEKETIKIYSTFTKNISNLIKIFHQYWHFIGKFLNLKQTFSHS